MTCPICNQKIDPSDHSEKWGPEFAHSRCVIAFTAGSAIQNAKLQDRIKRLEEAGKELRECASQLGWTSSEDPRWIERAEAAVKAWDKEAKP